MMQFEDYLQRNDWKDQNGEPVHAHGGCILRDNGVYYWYGEYKKGPTYNIPHIYHGQMCEMQRIDFLGVSCYRSEDFLHWEFCGLALAASEDENSPLHPSRVIERPKVLKNPVTGSYWMYFHCDDAEYQEACIGFARSERPEGPFTVTQVIRPNGHDSRDLTAFCDREGNGWLCYTSDYNATLHFVRLTKDYADVCPTVTEAFPGSFREAPCVFYDEERYYLLTSGCSGWAPNAAMLATAPAPDGPWTPVGNPCIGDGGDITYGCQCAYVYTDRENDKFLAILDGWDYHDLQKSVYLLLPFIKQKARFTLPWSEEFRGL